MSLQEINRSLCHSIGLLGHVTQPEQHADRRLRPQPRQDRRPHNLLLLGEYFNYGYRPRNVSGAGRKWFAVCEFVVRHCGRGSLVAVQLLGHMY